METKKLLKEYASELRREIVRLQVTEAFTKRASLVKPSKELDESIAKAQSVIAAKLALLGYVEASIKELSWNILLWGWVKSVLPFIR